ncbi:MAG TPA: MCP four helix bundle domain-containing protein, partial [Burkholderiaceae bacterium]
MFGNLKVGTRIALGFGAVVVLMLVISITAVWRLGTLNQATTSITEDIYPEVAYTADVVRVALEDGRHLREMLLARSDADIEQAWDAAAAARARGDELMKKLDHEIDTDKGRELFKAAVDRQAAIEARYARLHELARSDREKGAEYLKNDFSPANQAYRAALDELQKYEVSRMEAASRNSAEVYASTRLVVIGLAAVAMLMAVAVALLITRDLLKVLGGEPSYAAEVMRKVAVGDFTVDVSVRKGDTSSLLHTTREMVRSAGSSVDDVVRVMGAMAGGDLTQTITAQYAGSFGKMKDYVNETVEKLSQVVTEVNGGAEALAGASE